MSFLEKIRSGTERVAAAPARDTRHAGADESNRRTSNALKEFMWLLGDIKQAQVLDLGAISQHTVNFFIEREFKLYSEDLLRAWKQFLAEEEARLRAANAPVAATEEDIEYGRSALAERFLAANLAYPEHTFNAILVWDLLDYLEEEMLARLVKQLYAMLRPKGVVLGLFHSKKPAAFHRYRIVSPDTIELVPSPPVLPILRQFQNRDMMNLFSVFRSSKTFIGRDQLREGLFLK